MQDQVNLLGKQDTDNNFWQNNVSASVLLVIFLNLIYRGGPSPPRYLAVYNVHFYF